MRIQYGPPGHKGVTQIMGLGADDATVVELPRASDYLPSDAHRKVGAYALGIGVAAFLFGMPRLQAAALGGGVAIVACAHLMKQEAALVEPVPGLEPLPTAQGGFFGG